jgi:hypothetical protein
LIRKRFGTDPSGVYFNKVMCLINQRIGGDLPHCWYRFGDEVIRSCLPSSIEWSHIEGKTIVKLDTRDLDFDESIVKITNEVLDEFPMEGIEKIIDKIYSFAPYKFQRDFRDLRKEIDSIKDTAIQWEPLRKQKIAHCKEKALVSFPKKFRHGDLIEGLNLWNTLFDTILSHDPVDYKLLKNINETFWYQFCYHLRLDSNGNVPEWVLDRWMEDLEFDSRELYYQQLDIANDCLESGYRLPETILKAIESRKRDKAELDRELKDLYDGEDEHPELGMIKYSYSSRLK